MLWLIIGISLAVFSLMVWFFLGELKPVSKKKKKRIEQPVPEKNFEEIAKRLENRVGSLEKALLKAEEKIRLEQVLAMQEKSLADKACKALDQEKVWREKEARSFKKEQNQEKVLKEELTKTNIFLDQESKKRIKLDAEVKDLRSTHGELTAQVRQLTSKLRQLQKDMDQVSQDRRDLMMTNRELKKQKEDTAWVAKSDYRQLEELLKKVRLELEVLKKKIKTEVQESVEVEKPSQEETSLS